MRTLSESDGDTVEWKNNSFLEHEIISGNPDDGPSGLFSGVVPDPGSFIFTFNDVGFMITISQITLGWSVALP